MISEGITDIGDHKGPVIIQLVLLKGNTVDCPGMDYGTYFEGDIGVRAVRDGIVLSSKDINQVKRNYELPSDDGPIISSGPIIIHDLNGDGQPDFAVKIDGDSFGADYEIYSINKTGEIINLPIKDCWRRLPNIDKDRPYSSTSIYSENNHLVAIQADPRKKKLEYSWDNQGFIPMQDMGCPK